MSGDNHELAKIIANEGGKLPISTSLTRTQNEVTIDHGLWAAIRNRTDAIRSDSHINFIDRVLNCNDDFESAIVRKGDDGKTKQRVTAKEVSAPSIKERRDALSQLPVYG